MSSNPVPESASDQTGPPAGAGPARHRQGLSPDARSTAPWIIDFHDTSHEWRRLFAEILGTFMLVLVAAGAVVVDALSHGGVGRVSEVVAPGLMVMAIILFMGRVSGAHLNPAVTLAFALRKDFPWGRVPGYVLAQLLGATLACLLLAGLLGEGGRLGATLPGPGISGVQAMVVEALLTLGLVSTILGTASGAQNVGPLSALAVAGYVALAGLWASPLSGASMNPARSFGPAFVLHDFTGFWVYLVGPVLGAVAAVGAAYILRGPGGRDPSAAAAAQGADDQAGLGHPAQPTSIPPSGTNA